MEIICKSTVSAEFQAIRLKLFGNCASPQNFHTRKLGEITLFFVVNSSKLLREICECSVGLSGICCHILASLLFLKHFNETGEKLLELTPTEQLQKWRGKKNRICANDAPTRSVLPQFLKFCYDQSATLESH